MIITDMLQAWTNLSPSAEPDYYSVLPLNGSLYIAKDHSGLPCVLSSLAAKGPLPGGRETKGLRLMFHHAFHLMNEDGAEKIGPCAVLVCLDPGLMYLFAVLTEGLANAERRSVSEEHWPYEILRYIEEWQELVGRRSRLTPQAEIGLWGELYFLLGFTPIDSAMDYWHGPEGKRFDFSGNGIDIEVKTSLAGHVHHFSLQQLGESLSGSDRYVVSLHVEEDPAGGRSLTQMVAEVRVVVLDRLGLERRLCRLGYCDGDGYVDRFSVVDVLMVHSQQVPKVHSFDEGVSDIRFRADLARCVGLPQPELDLLRTRMVGGD